MSCPASTGSEYMCSSLLLQPCGWLLRSSAPPVSLLLVVASQGWLARAHALVFHLLTPALVLDRGRGVHANPRRICGLHE